MGAPSGLSDADIERVIPAEAEGRCAGETLEDLSIAYSIVGNLVRTLAIRTELLEDLRKAAKEKGFTITRITALSAAFADLIALDGETARFARGGELHEFTRSASGLLWRSVPVDEGNQEGQSGGLTLKSLSLPPEQAGPYAAIFAPEEGTPDLLGGAPDAPRTFAQKHHKSLLGMAAAAAFFFLALGLSLRQRAATIAGEYENARAFEEQLWKEYLPGRPIEKGLLLRAMKEELENQGDPQDSMRLSSALAFWAEVGAQLPDPNEIELTLRSLDLTQEGGRLDALVPAERDNPLSRAALLEASLNRSPGLTTHGDYENKDGKVHVRLRMDYHPGGPR